MARLRTKALAAAAEAVASGDEEGAEKARDIITAFTGWDTTREFTLKERKRTGDNVKMKLAALKEAMEVGHKTTNEQILKLTVVEGRWQDLEDAREERRLVMKACSDNMKLAEQKIRDLIASKNQLGLFESSSSTIDNPPKPEDDDDDDQEANDENDNDPDAIPD